MPYIKVSDRRRIVDKTEDQILVDLNEVKTAGEMQYVIAGMIKVFLRNKGLNYQNCNDVMGALAGAQQEFYRRTVAPYEDKKIIENGDI